MAFIQIGIIYLKFCLASKLFGLSFTQKLATKGLLKPGK